MCSVKVWPFRSRNVKVVETLEIGSCESIEVSLHILGAYFKIVRYNIGTGQKPEISARARCATFSRLLTTAYPDRGNAGILFHDVASLHRAPPVIWKPLRPLRNHYESSLQIL